MTVEIEKRGVVAIEFIPWFTSLNYDCLSIDKFSAGFDHVVRFFDYRHRCADRNLWIISQAKGVGMQDCWRLTVVDEGIRGIGRSVVKRAHTVDNLYKQIRALKSPKGSSAKSACRLAIAVCSRASFNTPKAAIPALRVSYNVRAMRTTPAVVGMSIQKAHRAMSSWACKSRLARRCLCSAAELESWRSVVIGGL